MLKIQPTKNKQQTQNINIIKKKIEIKTKNKVLITNLQNNLVTLYRNGQVYGTPYTPPGNTLVSFLRSGYIVHIVLLFNKNKGTKNKHTHTHTHTYIHTYILYIHT